MTFKEEFLEIYKSKITRAGSEALLKYLSDSDFFTAPASTRFHLATEGGLVEHSVNVYHRLQKLIEDEYGEDWEEMYSAESIAIVSLLHDICKIDMYTVDYRNVKTNGQWELKPYFAIDEKLPYGHGEKSVYIINGFMRLSREEAMAINWHMGAFDDRVKGGSYSIARAFEMYPLAVFTHSADFLTTYIDEGKSR